jgi:hypothetical protein
MIIVAASDESAGGDEQSPFFRGGFVAPADDWNRWFAPAWQERVLDGPPRLEYLHMTDVRDEDWRAQVGLSRTESERRVDEAFRVIDSTGTLVPITSQVDGGFFRSSFTDLRHYAGNRIDVNPDQVCFLAFAYVALSYASIAFPEADRVDFLVEANGAATRRLRKLFDLYKPAFQSGRAPILGQLVGVISEGTKHEPSLQAADVLCWHEQRRVAGKLRPTDARRYAKLAGRRGMRHIWSRDDVEAITVGATKAFQSKE